MQLKDCFLLSLTYLNSSQQVLAGYAMFAHFAFQCLHNLWKVAHEASAFGTPPFSIQASSPAEQNWRGTENLSSWGGWNLCAQAEELVTQGRIMLRVFALQSWCQITTLPTSLSVKSLRVCHCQTTGWKNKSKPWNYNEISDFHIGLDRNCTWFKMKWNGWMERLAQTAIFVSSPSMSHHFQVWPFYFEYYSNYSFPVSPSS